MPRLKARRFSEILSSSEDEEYKTKYELILLRERKDKSHNQRLERLKQLRSPEYKAQIAKQYAEILQDEKKRAKDQRRERLKEFNCEEVLTGDSIGTKRKESRSRSRRGSRSFRFEDDAEDKNKNKKNKNRKKSRSGQKIRSFNDLDEDLYPGRKGSGDRVRSGRSRFEHCDSIKYHKNKKEQKGKTFDLGEIHDSKSTKDNRKGRLVRKSNTSTYTLLVFRFDSFSF